MQVELENSGADRNHYHHNSSSKSIINNELSSSSSISYPSASVAQTIGTNTAAWSLSKHSPVTSDPDYILSEKQQKQYNQQNLSNNSSSNQLAPVATENAEDLTKMLQLHKLNV